ncbi:MAG: putative metalloprotease [Myxococcota bacterium]|jgi:predicted metalloprotease
MKWTRGHVSSNVEDRRGGGGGRRRAVKTGGVALGGGGVIGLIVFLLVQTGVIGGDVGQVVQSQVQGQRQAPAAPATPIDPATDKERPLVEFISFALDDIQGTWRKQFAKNGKRYQDAKLVLFSGSIDSACGYSSAAVGPFYCPADQKAYIDLSFYRELSRRFGAPGDFAQAYVLAHEIGHHVQTILGISSKVHAQKQRNPSRKNDLSVRQELQADCFAGVWAHSTSKRELLDRGDIEEGLRAASAIGDDTLQKKSGGRVQPESWTHGSSAMRMRWFKRGLNSGDMNSCDTYSTSRL